MSSVRSSPAIRCPYTETAVRPALRPECNLYVQSADGPCVAKWVHTTRASSPMLTVACANR